MSMSTPKPPSSPKKVSTRVGANSLSNMTQDEAWQFLNSMNPACHAAAMQYWNHINSNGGTRGESSITSAEVSLPSFTVSNVGMRGGGAMRTRYDGMPCSEKEMKALMSMFVEIMGLQMNTDRLNQVQTPETVKPSSAIKSKANKMKESPTFSSSVVMPVFRFPANVPPPPSGWPDSLVWPPTEDVPPDFSTLMDSIPLLEPIPSDERAKMIAFAQEAMKKARRHCKPYTPYPPVPGTPKEAVANATDPVTGTEGIVPPEWQTQVRFAIEDALEQEELLGIRLRKHEKDSSSKTPKKAQGKPGLVPPVTALSSRSMTSNEAASAMQKVEDANRKLSKAVGMWRNRVVSAVAQNEVQKLELLVAESPLRTVSQMQQQAASVLNFHNQHLLHYPHNRSQVESVEDHLKQLVPLTVMAKLGAGVHGGGVETRLLLAVYICQEFSVQHFLLPGRNGRNALHMACMMGDLSILQLILDKALEQLDPPMVYSAILQPCQDSGWNSLHYAVSSGSLRVVQCVLQCLNACSSDEEECDLQKAIQSASNDALSWKRGEPQQGITVQHLAVALMSHEPETMIETHGMALQEISNYRLRSNKPSVDPSVYVTMLSQMTIHLILIQSLGYTPLTEEDIVRAERQTPQNAEKCEQGGSGSTTAQADETSECDPPPWIDSDDETSRMTKEDAKKKRKRKKKGKKSDAAAASVASSSNEVTSSAVAVVPTSKDDTSVDDESEVSKPSTTATTDPLVSALLGMGFEYASIMGGIKACGGMSRATADDVVAWIVGGGTTTLSNGDTQTMPLPKAAISEPLSFFKKPPTTAALQAELEKRNKEVVRQKEEERMLAEKLAAKREEQRRRNREWNTRAQARQIQEIQEKMTAKATNTVQAKPPVASGMLRSVSGGSNFAPTYPVSSVTGRVPSPTSGLGISAPDASATTPSRMVAATTTRSRLNLGPSISESNRFGDNADGSTIASSVDHGIIEIGGNDDATVSTIGSFPAMYPPQAPPPGFASGQLLSAAHALEGPATAQRSITQAQWEAHRSMLPNDSYNTNMNNHNMGFGRLGVGPIIPETGPLPNFHGNYYSGMPPLPLNLSSHSSGMHPTMGSSSGTEADLVRGGGTNLFGSGSPTLVRNEERTNFAGDGVFGSTLLSSGYPPPTPPAPSNFLERSISAPSHISSSFVNDPSSPSLTDYFGFGADMNQKAIDASIIDSISTGNAGISGSALWGTPDARNENGGSSLLRNLINSSNSDYTHETSLFPATNETTDTRFSNATAYHSNDGLSWEQERLSKLHSSKEGTIGPSIW
jgi:Ankyrin repeats (3 copies)